MQVSVKPAHEGEEIVRTKSAGGLAAGLPRRGKLQLGRVLQERAHAQAGKVFLRKKRIAAAAPEVAGNRIKVHQRGEAVAGGMEFQFGRTLAEREVVFMAQAFVGGEHQHGAVRRGGQTLQQMERGRGKENSGGGQSYAVPLKNVI